MGMVQHHWCLPHATNGQKALTLFALTAPPLGTVFNGAQREGEPQSEREMETESGVVAIREGTEAAKQRPTLRKVWSLFLRVAQ